MPATPSQEAPVSPTPSTERSTPPSYLSTSPRALIVAFGFATTVLMWAIGYACMTQPGLLVGEILFVLMLGTLALGGYASARVLGSIRAGAWVGLVSATVNLLIVGSLIRPSEDGSILASAITWILGLYVISVALCLLGATVGVRRFQQAALPMATGFFSLLAAATVFLLLITGGLVTGLEAGLAVPDWPNSFGHNMLLYPLSEMTGGVYYEHAHRLYGMLVGLTTITLLLMVFLHDRRTWMKVLVSVVFLMVCIQGIMGGLRVTGAFTLSQEHTTPNIALAIIHGVFGQVVFACFCWLAIASSRAWGTSAGIERSVDAEKNRFLAGTFVVALVIQLLLGAFYRHMQAPVTAEATTHHPTWALVAHIAFSVVVVLLAIYLGMRLLAHEKAPLARVLGQAIIVIVAFQFLLGIAAFASLLLRPEGVIPSWELISTSAHQANGALLLGTSVALAALKRHQFAQEPVPQMSVA